MFLSFIRPFKHPLKPFGLWSFMIQLCSNIVINNTIYLWLQTSFKRVHKHGSIHNPMPQKSNPKMARVWPRYQPSNSPWTSVYTGQVMLSMPGPIVLLEVGYLKVRSMRPPTLYIGWKGLRPPRADLLNPNCWIWVRPTIKMEETFGQLQGDCWPRQMIIT